MPSPNDLVRGFARRVPLAATALRWWGPRQWWAAAAGAVLVGAVLGVATVLIPNGIFSRDIPPTAWSYPVWIATSAMSGLLAASYVRLRRGRPATGPASRPETSDRGSGWGLAGGLLAWFAIGCPVCNKIALLALGYSGALAYFAPLQPWLATLALLLTALAVVQRLSGQVECVLPARGPAAWERTPA